jgi:hypothetical protein
MHVAARSLRAKTEPAGVPAPQSRSRVSGVGAYHITPPSPRPNALCQAEADTLDHCCHAWNRLVARPWTMMSIGSATGRMGSDHRDLGRRQMLDLVRIPARPERQAYGHAGDPERAREIASSPAAAPSHLAPGPARNARGARTVRRWRQPGCGASRRPTCRDRGPRAFIARGITPGRRPRIRRNGSGYRPWSTAQPGRPW